MTDPALEHDQARLREIDALVAEKVMGWRVNGYMYASEGGFMAQYTGVSVDTNFNWSPSTSWDAAGQVVESWAGDVTVKRQNGSWWVEFCRPSEEFGFWADTFPLAVCCAALKAHGVPITYTDVPSG